MPGTLTSVSSRQSPWPRAVACCRRSLSAGVRALVELLQNTDNEWLRLQVAIFLVRESHRAAEKSGLGPHGFPPVRTITVIDPSENMEHTLSNVHWDEEAGAMVEG